MSFNLPRRVLLQTSIAAAFLIPLSTGCDSPLGIACTNAGGCIDGLYVELSELPAGPFSISVSPVLPERLAATDRPLFRYECATGTGCLQSILFAGYMSSQAHVQLIIGSDTTLIQNRDVTYEPMYFNGPRCAASCTMGTLQIELP